MSKITPNQFKAHLMGCVNKINLIEDTMAGDDRVEAYRKLGTEFSMPGLADSLDFS